MKLIHAKFSLFLLLISTVITAFGQSKETVRSEKEFKNLGEKSIPMDLETFKRFIDGANLTELEISFLLGRLSQPRQWGIVRDLGPKMLFLVEKMSPKRRRGDGLGFPLLWAYEHNDRAMIKKLRAFGGDISWALGRAIPDKPRLIPALLKDGAQPDQETLQGAIHFSEENETLRSMLPQLVNAFKNINERDDISGATALHVAASRGNKKIAEMIVKAGVNLNAQDNEGNTALTEAMIEMGSLPLGPKERQMTGPQFLKLFPIKPYVELVTYLVQQGANPNIKNKKGESALSIAKKAKFTDLVTLFEKKQGVQKRRPR